MKKQALDSLYSELLAASAREYGITGDDVVFGDGNPDAEVLLIGEAPGAEEIRQKKPFVGKAGENLSEFLEALQLKRQDIYITNVVKFRTYTESEKGRRKNRTPSGKEQQHQSEFLYREVEIIRPKFVVTLGNTALRAVYKEGRAVVGQMHGNAVQLRQGSHGFYLFPLYHPASIIYNRSLKDVYLSDLQALKLLL